MVGFKGSENQGPVNSGIGMSSRRTARGGVKGLVKGSVNVRALVGIATDEVATDDDKLPEQIAPNASMLLPIPFPIFPSTPKLSQPFSSDESAPSTPQTLCHALLPCPTLLDSAGTPFPLTCHRVLQLPWLTLALAAWLALALAA